ncbi:ABC transporter substrate-binding protein [Cupriavidus sp. UYMMa02A]|nr:ABC transporter substrate-binding protein [Cupriavidus sp. UYMMa02A]
MNTTYVSAAMLAALVCYAGTAVADVKIGLSATLSGPQAIVGQEQVDGFTLALEYLGGRLGGQKAVVLKEDDQLRPDLGTQITQKFIEREKVDILVGLGFTNVAMASLRRVVSAGIPALATNSGPSLVAGQQCAANFFSLAWQNDGAAEAMGKLAQEKGLKRVYLMAPNYQAGRDMLTGFKRFYKGAVVDEVYTQLTQPDYSSELAALQAAKPDGVFVFYPGSLGVNFIKQLSQAGLLGKIPLYSVFTVDGTTLPGVGAAAAGAISGAMWDAALPGPENQRFVSAFSKRFGRVPSEYAAVAYDAANLLDAALKRTGGNAADKPALVAAIKTAGAEFKSVRGPFRFNRNNMPVQNYYAFETRNEGGKAVTQLVTTPLRDHQDAYVDRCGLR